MKIVSINNQEFSELVERLKEGSFIKSQSDLANAIGENKQGITDLKSGKKKVTMEHLESIKEAFPNFDLREFLSDKIRNFLTEAVQLRNEHQLPIKKGIPFYDISAVSGAMVTFDDLSAHIVDYLHFPGFDDCDFAVINSGDSMLGKFNPGDYLLCKEVQDRSLLISGAPYFVITSEYKTVKYVFPRPKEGVFLLRPENSFYEDFEVPMDKVFKIYHVKGAASVKRIAI